MIDSPSLLHVERADRDALLDLIRAAQRPGEPLIRGAMVLAGLFGYGDDDPDPRG
jgi:hypothetical protein